MDYNLYNNYRYNILRGYNYVYVLVILINSSNIGITLDIMIIKH